MPINLAEAPPTIRSALMLFVTTELGAIATDLKPINISLQILDISRNRYNIAASTPISILQFRQIIVLLCIHLCLWQERYLFCNDTIIIKTNNCDNFGKVLSSLVYV